MRWSWRFAWERKGKKEIFIQLMFLLHWVFGVLKRLLLLFWDAAFVVCDHGFLCF